jgi:AcrR family transcriptional regulator
MCCGTRAEIYDPLLAAADELVTTNGPEVALDEIARRAGVANATLYRHFPDGRDLLVAVCVSEVKALCTLGEQLDQNPDAGQALTPVAARLHHACQCQARVFYIQASPWALLRDGREFTLDKPSTATAAA